MQHLDRRLARLIDAERIPADLDARLALREAADGQPHPLRLTLGRALVAIGRWVAAEPPPLHARPLQR